MTAAWELCRLLEVRYPAPSWALLYEVAAFTGMGGGNHRYADAVALSLWQSQGIALHGFEIKVSKQDLRKELSDPSKADAIGKFCDYWWLVLADKDLAEGLEVPEAWGVLAPQKGQLRAVKKAPKRERQVWTPGFVASLFRRFTEKMVTRSQHEVQIQTLKDSIAAEAEKRAPALAGDLERELLLVKKDRDYLRQIHEKFEEHAGIRLAEFNVQAVGSAVGVLTNPLRYASVVDGLQRGLDKLLHVQSTLGQLNDNVRTAIAALESSGPPPAAVAPEVPDGT